MENSLSSTEVFLLIQAISQYDQYPGNIRYIDAYVPTNIFICIYFFMDFCHFLNKFEDNKL